MQPVTTDTLQQLVQPAQPVQAQSACSPNSSENVGVDAASDKADDAPKAKRFSTVKTTDGELDATQQAALDKIIRLNNERMPKLSLIHI